MLASRQLRLGSSVACDGRRRLRAPPSGRTSVKVYALFGWGKKKSDEPDPNDWREIERRDQARIQKEMLARRKSGQYVSEAQERRKKVKDTIEEKKAARKEERNQLAQGKLPDSYRDWQPYDKEAMENGNSGIVVPLLPFGLRKFDEGERFDLRSPYSDDGWVDPEETDMWAGLKKLSTKVLDFTNGQALREQGGKPILWAADYNKYVQDKENKGKAPPPGAKGKAPPPSAKGKK